MGSVRACPICTNSYGGAVVPTLLTCCQNHVCFDCAEKDRNAQISQLVGNKTKIGCMFCKELFHSGKETPWKVNRPFISLIGIEVDMSAVKESQAAMQTVSKWPRNAEVGAVSSLADPLNGEISTAASTAANRHRSLDNLQTENPKCIEGDEWQNSRYFPEITRTKSDTTQNGAPEASISSVGRLRRDKLPARDDAVGTYDSSGESRFSYTSTKDEAKMEACACYDEETICNRELSQSSPISREQLHCLTGGIRGGKRNPGTFSCWSICS
ncbi:hypothetical protein ACHAWF_014594 [Thalassiosira exigua]